MKLIAKIKLFAKASSPIVPKVKKIMPKEARYYYQRGEVEEDIIEKSEEVEDIITRGVR